SYFGPTRVKGKRGRGAGLKTIVFGLYKRGGEVYTEIVPDCKSATLSAIIRGRADIESVIYSDDWRGYDGLVDLGYEKHFRVNHGENEFSKGNGNHINGIESFWIYAKHRLNKFKGIKKEKFILFLKETEFRFNNRNKNLYKFLLKLFRENPLF
ncbi:MAG: IS1595 family transposase, partial [Oscillospiraceae bacterium]|nr:IS1595 family transposase [Oscillospiraceae bacterium]